MSNAEKQIKVKRCPSNWSPFPTIKETNRFPEAVGPSALFVEKRFGWQLWEVLVANMHAQYTVWCWIMIFAVWLLGTGLKLHWGAGGLCCPGTIGSSIFKRVSVWDSVGAVGAVLKIDTYMHTCMRAHDYGFVMNACCNTEAGRGARPQLPFG